MIRVISELFYSGMKHRFYFIVKEQFFPRGTNSAIMPSFGEIIKIDFPVQNVMFWDEKRKIHTERACRSYTAEISKTKKLQMHSQHSPALLAFTCLITRQSKRSLSNDLHIASNF